jgi:hypothetical protein
MRASEGIQVAARLPEAASALVQAADNTSWQDGSENRTRSYCSCAGSALRLMMGAVRSCEALNGLVSLATPAMKLHQHPRSQGTPKVETHPFASLRKSACNTPLFYFSFLRPVFISSHRSRAIAPHICPLWAVHSLLLHPNSTVPAHPLDAIAMSDDKKSDDYRVDIPSARSSRAPSPVMRSPQKSVGSITENPVAAILGYCGSSILMTVTNKYVLSGVDFNLNFFLLAVQVWLYKAIIQSTVLTRYRLLSV